MAEDSQETGGTWSTSGANHDPNQQVARRDGGVRQFGKEYASDTEGDGPCTLNGVQLKNIKSLEVWNDFYQKNLK